MHLIVLLIGAVLAAAGVAMVNRAVPVEDVAGAALFTSGVVAIVGALIIAALAVVARNLGRIAERLEIQPLPLPPVAAVGREDPAPRPVRAALPAAGPARSSLLGWLGRTSRPVLAGDAPTAPQRTPPAPDPATPPPVDLAPLTRIPETAPPPVPAPPVRPQPRSASATPNGAAATIYRSGVIDGMAYSLYMDGSIEAELPTGRVKFATIDELQQYLVSKK